MAQARAMRWPSTIDEVSAPSAIFTQRRIGPILAVSIGPCGR
jgi:hypothetical protein